MSVTDWHYVDTQPAWNGSNVIAYRIHRMNDGRIDWFRHEWWYYDGRTRMDDWIRG